MPLCVTAVAAWAFPAGALADGDPASDYLARNQVFLTSQSTSQTSAERRLVDVVAAANRAGFTIRVATIFSEYDLGSITELWRKPQIYAEFLGLELSQAYKQRLLVVMPNGFGFNWPGHSAAAAYRLLTKLGITPGGDGVSAAAQAAVRQLAAAAGVAGVAIRVPAEPRRVASSPGHGSGIGWIVALVLVLLALATAVVIAVRRLGGRRQPVPLRLAVPGVAILCGVAAGVPIVALSGRQGAATPQPAASAVATPPPFSWPAGSRAAPEFALRDQSGSPVSIAAYRGRPLIVTFVDPLCRNLCPLEAHVLNSVVGTMPVAQRPEIVAVSVDVYADARVDLLQDVREWKLVPQWHWAIGTPEQLAAVWKHYQIGVSVTTKHIARTTIRYILHTEAAYVIDATGHERALFVWPFYPQDVQRTLRQIT